MPTDAEVVAVTEGEATDVVAEEPTVGEVAAGEPEAVEIIDDEAAIMEPEQPVEILADTESVAALDAEENALVEEAIASASEITGMTEEEIGDVIVDIDAKEVVAPAEELIDGAAFSVEFEEEIKIDPSEEIAVVPD